jgi:hypothetical protein
MILAPLLALTTAIQASTTDAAVWHWDRDNSGCALQQNIDDRKVLEISRTPGNAETSLIIKGSKPISYAAKILHGGTIFFQPTGPVDAEGTVVEGADGRREIYAGSRDPTFMGKFSGATELGFIHEKIGETKVPIRAAEAAVTAIRACEDTKMREWGINPVAWRALPVKPVPKTKTSTWLSWLDYPDRKKIYKNDISVVARLDLGADGTVLGCTVVNQPPSEFIGPACKALKTSAKLQPARDVSGNGTPAPYVIEIRFGAFLL